MGNKIANQFKDTIRTLVETGELGEAKVLLEEYKKLNQYDIDTYSIAGVIAMMEGDMDEAGKYLCKGLEIQPSNEDLNFNMTYLINQLEDKENALELFCKLKLFNTSSSIGLKDVGLEKARLNKGNLRVVQGTIEIANQMNVLNQGLKSIGVDSKTINYYPSYLQYDSGHTLDINSFSNFNEANIKTKELAAKLIANNDVFHFHFGTSLTLDHSDLPLLEELGKKVVMQYWGSDVRMYSKAIKLNPYVKVKDMDEDKIRRNLEIISRYIPNCLVDYELAEYVKDYYENIHYTRVSVDLNKYKFVNKTNNEKLLIVHAPTAPEYKGTPYILKAIEELKQKYDFDFQLVQGMPHEEAVAIYKKADLVIDQILGGGYGVFAIETMAMGKPVICWISDFMKDKYPKELPIILANPDDIKEKIEYAIKNKDMLEEIGVKGRRYVEKYCDIDKNCQYMIDIYNKL